MVIESARRGVPPRNPPASAPIARDPAAAYPLRCRWVYDLASATLACRWVSTL